MSEPSSTSQDIWHDITLHKQSRHGRAQLHRHPHHQQKESSAEIREGDISHEPTSNESSLDPKLQESTKVKNEKGEVVLGYHDDNNNHEHTESKSTSITSPGHPPESHESTYDAKPKKRKAQIHHFDTFKLSESLKSSGFTNGQAVVLTYAIQACIANTWGKLRQQTMTQSNLENDAYYYRSSLAELRTEIQVLRKNDQFLLQAECASIEREIEALKQQMKEDMSNLRSDIQIEMNSRKRENSDAVKKQEMGRHEMATKYQIVMSEMTD